MNKCQQPKNFLFKYNNWYSFPLITSCFFAIITLSQSNALIAGSLSQEQICDSEASSIIQSIDANKDGKLASNEVDTMFRFKRFKRVDINGDGLLDVAELKNSCLNAAKAGEQRAKQGPQESNPIKNLINEITTPTNQISQIQDSGQRYKVEPGDSIYRIAKKFNVAEEDLMKLNAIENESVLPINKVLLVPASK
jgi:LysM repeat protein